MTYISFKSVEVWPRGTILKVGVQLLFPNCSLKIQAVDSQKVRPLVVVLDETEDAAVSLIPLCSRRWIGKAHLDNRRCNALEL